MGGDVALVEAGLVAGKAAIDRHAAFEGEGGGPGAGRAGVVHPFGRPDLVAGDGYGQGGLQVTGVGPNRSNRRSRRA